MAVGVSVYLFELMVIYAAQHAGANPVLAVSISFWLGLLASFALQKLFTFRDRRMHHRIVLAQLLAVIGLVVFNFGFTLLIAQLLRHRAPAMVSRTIALAITSTWNFYLYKTRIFMSAGEPVY